MSATYNTNENVNVVMKAIINSSEANKMVCNAALNMVKTGCAIPEELEDLFTIQIITRPSGSKYALVDFA